MTTSPPICMNTSTQPPLSIHPITSPHSSPTKPGSHYLLSCHLVVDHPVKVAFALPFLHGPPQSLLQGHGRLQLSQRSHDWAKIPCTSVSFYQYVFHPSLDTFLHIFLAICSYSAPLPVCTLRFQFFVSRRALTKHQKYTEMCSREGQSKERMPLSSQCDCDQN